VLPNAPEIGRIGIDVQVTLSKSHDLLARVTCHRKQRIIDGKVTAFVESAHA
jgi:hypothetical protein